MVENDWPYFAGLSDNLSLVCSTNETGLFQLLKILGHTAILNDVLGDDQTKMSDGSTSQLHSGHISHKPDSTQNQQNGSEHKDDS